MLQVGEFSWFFNVFSGFLVGALSFLLFQKKLFSAFNELQEKCHPVKSTWYLVQGGLLVWDGHTRSREHMRTEAEQQVELEKSAGMGYKPGIPVLQPFGRVS
jgi:hypothetical protein